MEHTKEFLEAAKKRMLEEALEECRELFWDRSEFEFIGKIVDFEQGVPNNKIRFELLQEIEKEALAKANSFKRNCVSKARFSALAKYLSRVPRWYKDPEDYLDYEDQLSPYKHDGYFWRYKHYLHNEIEEL